MTADEKQKLQTIYDTLCSGRTDYARLLLEELLGITEQSPEPEAA